MEKLDLILSELQRLNERVIVIEQNMATKEELNEVKQSMATELNGIRQNMATKDELNEIRQNMATKDELNEIRQNMATKDDIADIQLIKQAVLETNQDVKKILDDQKSIYEILGEHEVSIRTLRRRPV